MYRSSGDPPPPLPNPLPFTSCILRGFQWQKPHTYLTYRIKPCQMLHYDLSMLRFSQAVDAAAVIGILVVGYVVLCCLLWLMRLTTNRLRGGISQFHRQGAWAVVTGASRGIGAEFARDLASRGFNVFLLARDEERMKVLQVELQEKHGVHVKFSSFDFAAPDVLPRAAAVLSTIGINSISVLINNVGYLSEIPEPYLDHSPGYVDRLIRVNISAMQEMTRLILPSMCERGEKGKRPECCLINVSSLSAMLTVPLMTVYSASKAYVSTFTAALATEYSGKVCIMSVEPGTARTEMCFNKYEGIGNPHPRSVAKGALDFAGCALVSFTPHYFHQARPRASASTRFIH